MLLPTIIENSAKSQHALLLLQSSAAQSALPILQQLVAASTEFACQTLVFCLLYSPSKLMTAKENEADHKTIQFLDRTGNIPGYSQAWTDPRNDLLATVENAAAGPVNVIVDSVDTLVSDIGSEVVTYTFLNELLSLVSSRPKPSRLILHMDSSCPIIPLLVQTSLSPTLTYIRAHPPELLTHLAKAYGTPPPPASPPAKFWGVFIPFSERHYETDRLVFGPGGEGCGGGATGDIVVEVLVRGYGLDGRKRGVDRVLEGWCVRSGPCELSALASLRGITATTVEETRTAPDPTQDLTFNLNLTPAQSQSRASVPLPYVQQGKDFDVSSKSPSIFYEPDSADDLDDDDPDEDLDI